MDFNIPCSTFVRLSRLALDVQHEGKEEYKSIYIENRNGHSIAVSTNIKFAAIEYLGSTQQPNGVIAVEIEDKLLSQAITEAPLGSIFTIVAIPEISLATLKSTYGYARTNDFTRNLSYSKQFFTEWRKWLPDQLPDKSNGAMFLNAHNMQALINAAPSGEIVFPKYIDTSKPVIVRDTQHDNWIGAFMGISSDYNSIPATLPTWVK